MSNGLNAEEQRILGFIITGLIIIGAAIVIARKLFAWFLILSIIFFISFIIFMLIELFTRDHSNLEIWDYISTYIGIAFLIMLVGLSITYFIGYGLGGTSFGQAALDVYYTFNEAERLMENSITDLVEETCKTIPEKDCITLKNYAKTAKTLQEVADMANILKKVK